MATPYKIHKAEKSSSNNTISALDNGETFTGAWELNDATDVMVTVKTDQDGTLYMDFSPDGTNVDSTLSYAYDTTRINPPHILVKGARYYRTRFENNSGSNQTYIRLQTDFGHFQKLTASINGTLAESSDALVTRPTDFHYEVAMGKRQGNTTWNKFGYNTDVDSAAPEVVAAQGGAIAIMTSADTLDVVSDSTDDDTGGIGATSILITGIDENNLSQIEIVTLDGTTPVTTSNSWLGVNRVVVLSSGSNDANVGNITIDDTANAVGVQAYLPAGGSVTQQCIFHTQINHTFLADYIRFKILKPSGGGSGNGYLYGYSYSRVTDTVYEVFREPYSTTSTTNTVVELRPSQPFVIGGREVLYFVLESDANNVTISGRFSGIEERIS